MRFASALSTAPRLDDALAEACTRALTDLDGARVDLAVVFAAGNYGPELDRVPALAYDHLSPRALLGCSGGGIIGGRREIEARPAVSVTVAHLPGGQVDVRHVDAGDLPNADAEPRAWRDRLGVDRDTCRGFLVLPEPYQFPADRLLAGLDYAYPGIAKVGGVASGSRHPRGNVLFAGRTTHHTGAVVAAVTGEITMAAIVAQGCKPIGAIGTITGAQHNLLLSVDKLPAARFLEQQIEALDPVDRELATTQPLFLGIAMTPFTAKDQLGPGDYLIRNLLGFDPQSGSLTIGDLLAAGRRVQFHVMDHHTSAYDLRRLLHKHKALQPGAPSGGLLFSCLGRGTHLYGEPDHDSRLFREELADVPLGGFFCNGEIGPVHDTTYLHGYTAAFALLSPRTAR